MQVQPALAGLNRQMVSPAQPRAPVKQGLRLLAEALQAQAGGRGST